MKVFRISLFENVNIHKDIWRSAECRIKDSANRYFLSFVVEVWPEVLPKTDNSVGIDLGIKTFATLSNGKKIDAPKPLRKRMLEVPKTK